MEGVLTNMMTTKLTVAATKFLVAGLVSAGVGVTAYSAIGRDEAAAPAQATGPNLAQSAPQKKDAAHWPGKCRCPSIRAPSQSPKRRDGSCFSDSEEQVKALIREFKEKRKALRLLTGRRRPTRRQGFGNGRANPAAFAGALLQLAELDPGTSPAEEALIWIVTNLVLWLHGGAPKEMIPRDHIRSDKIEPVFQDLS